MEQALIDLLSASIEKNFAQADLDFIRREREHMRSFCENLANPEAGTPTDERAQYERFCTDLTRTFGSSDTVPSFDEWKEASHG